MKTYLKPVLCGIVVALALPLAACGSEDAAEPAQAGAGDGKPAKAKAKLELGEETALEGLDGELKVRVSKVIDPMPNPPTERPKPGRRFAGVVIEITNTSGKAYKDSLLNGSKLVTDVSKGANGTILLTGDCPSSKSVKFRLAKGASKQLCLPFQVKKKAKIRAFQFRLNSGYGRETGEWAVR